MNRNSFLNFLLILIACLSLFSCASNSNALNAVNAFISSGNYIQARSALEAQKEKLYSDNDKVLYNLDGGIISHYAGDWKQSNTNLSEAESLIDFYYTKSISQGVESYLINDSMVDYAGDDYEDIFTNFFMSLNYVQLGLIDDALVEVRRFDNKLKQLSTKYEDQFLYAKENLGSSAASSVSMQFANSAAARYLSMLLYRSEGRLDSAEVDMRLLKKAFQDQPAIYNFSVPSFLDDELNVPSGMARLNVFCFAGQSPIKRDVTKEYELPNGVKYILSLPEMVKRGTQVASIKVEVFNEDGTVVASVNDVVETKVEVEEPVTETVPATGSSRSAAARARAQAMGITSPSSIIAEAEAKTKQLEEERLAAQKAMEQKVEKFEGRTPSYATSLELLESVENIAYDTFQQNLSSISNRAMIRAAGKAIKNSVFEFVADNAQDKSVSTLFSIISFVSQTVDEETEKADTRTSRFFPAQIYAGGITLKPGVYSVVVTCRDASGSLLSTTVNENMIVSAKSVNIVEAVCSK